MQKYGILSSFPNETAVFCIIKPNFTIQAAKSREKRLLSHRRNGLS